MRDLVERQAVIDALDEEPAVWDEKDEYEQGLNSQWHHDVNAIKALPSAQPTLYGYEINHLAYIAKIMEKEGVTAEYAVRTFGDISRAVRMTIEEAIEIASKECGEFRGIYERIKDGVDALPSAH